MKEIWSDVESIVIQGAVGMKEESFNLSNLPALIALEIGCGAFKNCHSIVFESMNDWMNDELDLNQLQSITLEYGALYGDCETKESNELIMKSMNDKDGWLIRSPFSIFIQRRWSQFTLDRHSDIREWWLIIEFELDIPSLTEDHIWMNASVFSKVRELHSSSRIDWLLMMKMLILLNNLSYRGMWHYNGSRKQ